MSKKGSADGEEHLNESQQRTQVYEAGLNEHYELW